jgi:hypothetical protein
MKKRHDAFDVKVQQALGDSFSYKDLNGDPDLADI